MLYECLLCKKRFNDAPSRNRKYCSHKCSHVILRQFLKGGKASKERRQKISIGLMGNKNSLGKTAWNKGLSRKEETKIKISESHKGKKLSEETKIKIGIANSRREVSLNTRKKISASRIGNKNPMWGKSGILSPGWKGGKSFEPYGLEFNINLKRKIRKRDDFFCQLCGTKENGRDLSVHHIDYNKKNGDDFSLISLCVGCNAKVNYGRDKWQFFFEVYQEIRLTKIVT